MTTPDRPAVPPDDATGQARLAAFDVDRRPVPDPVPPSESLGDLDDADREVLVRYSGNPAWRRQ